MLAKPYFYTGLNMSDPFSIGLIASYLFNENNGNIVNDLTGNRNNGTFTNSPTWSPGNNIHRCGVMFDATTEHIVSINGGLLQANGTIAFSYKHNGTPPASYYYWFSLEDDYSEFSLPGYVSGDEEIVFNINGTWATFNAGDWQIMIDEEWHDVIVTWNDATNLRALYVDGLLRSSALDAFTWSSGDMSGGNICIGGRVTGADRYAAGTMGYFHAWDHDFSADKVAGFSKNQYRMFHYPDILPFIYVSGEAGLSIPVAMHHYLRH